MQGGIVKSVACSLQRMRERQRGIEGALIARCGGQCPPPPLREQIPKVYIIKNNFVPGLFTVSPAL